MVFDSLRIPPPIGCEYPFVVPLLKSVVKLVRDKLYSCVGVIVNECAAGAPTGFDDTIGGATSAPMSVST